MLSRLKFFLIGLFLAGALSCQTNNSLDSTDIPDNEPEAATSEITPDIIRPILLIDPIENLGSVETDQVEISGSLVANTNITSFTVSLNANTPIDQLSNLSQNNDFMIRVSGLNVGTNTVTIEVVDELNATTNLDLTISYTPPAETPETPDPDDTENPEDTNDTLIELILDILNAGQNQYHELAELIEIFKDNEAALSAILEFLNTWDGSDAELQSFWNEWANAGTAKVFNPKLPSRFQNNNTQNNKWQLEDIRLAINNIEHLSNSLLPLLADNLNDIENTDDFIALQNQKDVLGCEFEWTIKITKIESDLQFDAASVSDIEFLNNNQVAVTLNLDQANMDSNFKLIASPPKACIFNESIRTGKINAKKLSGQLVLQLGYNSTSNQIHVQSIVSSTLAVDSVSSQMDETNNFWQALEEWIFKRLYGCNFCSNSDAEKALFQYIFEIEDNNPYKKMFNTALQKDDHVQNLLMAELNKLFANSLQFQGTIATENSDQSFDYQAQMTGFVTQAQTQQLISNWDLDVQSLSPRDSCARHFKIPSIDFKASDMPNLGDIGVQLTYSHIANTLRGIARTGAFCFEDQITFNNFTLAQLNLKPYGTIDIAKSNQRNSHLDITYPFEIEVVWGNEDVAEQNFTPITSINSNNKIYGELLMSVHFSTSCDGGLTLSVDRTQLLSLAGTLKINAYSFDLSPIEDELQDWLSNLSFAELQNIPITGQMFSLEKLPGMSIQILNEFEATDSDISFGLKFVSDSNCH